METKISISDQNIDSILVIIGNKIKHIVGVIDCIIFDDNNLNSQLIIGRILFKDKIYNTFNIEIKYKSGDITILENYNIIKTKNTFYCEAVNLFILEDIIISNI